MPRGASPKRERQYEKIKQSAKKSGRYGSRAEEVAARTVNKIRRDKGETKPKRARSSAASRKRSAWSSRGAKSRSKTSGTRSRKSATASRGGRTSLSRRSSSRGRGFA